MSHFVVLVVGPDVEGQLARYDENREVDPYKDYQQVEEYQHDWLRTHGVKDFTDLDAVAKCWNESDYLGYQVQVDEGGIYSMSTYNPDSQWDGYQVQVDEGGIYSMSTYNPDSQWDYWRVGGRWVNWLKVRDSATSAEAGDIPWEFSFNPDQKQPETAWVSAKAGDIDWDATLRSHGPYAIVAEGVWKAKDKMGWFGVDGSDEGTQEDWDAWAIPFLRNLSADMVVTVVDCHI